MVALWTSSLAPNRPNGILAIFHRVLRALPQPILMPLGRLTQKLLNRLHRARKYKRECTRHGLHSLWDTSERASQSDNWCSISGGTDTRRLVVIVLACIVGAFALASICLLVVRLRQKGVQFNYWVPTTAWKQPPQCQRSSDPPKSPRSESARSSSS